MMFMAVFWLVVAVVAIRWLMTPGAERLPPDRARRTEAELARLREEVDRLNRQVDRLIDEQSFLLRLLGPGERPRLPDRKTDPEE